LFYVKIEIMELIKLLTKYMSKKIFTQDQIKQLSENNCIFKCSEKSITYDNDFKIEAIKQFEKGMSSKEIFLEAGLDINIIGKKQPKDCLKRWRKIYKEKGIEGFSTENRGKTKGGGRPTTKGLTDKEKIERLELTVAYQKEKIIFLAKLRAKRKE